jgi:hypothetical protein
MDYRSFAGGCEIAAMAGMVLLDAMIHHMALHMACMCNDVPSIGENGSWIA